MSGGQPDYKIWVTQNFPTRESSIYSNLKLYLKQNFQPASIGFDPILKIIVGSLISDQSSLFDSTSSL